MRVLVFGGAGFLGSSLLPMLGDRGHEVIAPRSVEFDLLDTALVRQGDIDKRYRNVDAVVHAAAFYGGMPFDIDNQARVLSANTQMNLNVFEFCRRIEPGKLVTIGSACAYPGYADHDLSEHHFHHGPLHETVECHGFSKLWMMVAHRAFHATYGLRGVHLVPANLYGPHDVYQLERSHVVAALIKKFTDAADGSDVHLMGDGSAVREFLYIDDLARMIVRSIERLQHEEAPINIGTGVGHTIAELADTIGRHTGYGNTIRWDTSAPNGAPRKVMDVTRMQQVLGPYDCVTLDNGIRQTLQWYLPRKAQADLRE